VENDISFSQLRCFVAVVDAGTLAEAGRRLGMATASVSKAIARLEEAAGAKLIHRSTHALSLTEDGERLIGPAREAIRAAGVFQQSAVSRAPSGWVRISAPVALTRDVLTPLLADFIRSHPEIRLDLRASNELVDLARDGIDLAIRSGSLTRLPGHLQTTWFKFPWVVCASPKYLEGSSEPKRPDDLREHALIGYRNQRTGQVRPWTFRRKQETIQIAPNPTSIFDDGASAWKATVSAAGIVSAPLWLAADDLRAGRVVELLREWRDVDTVVSFLRRDPSARVNRVIEHLRRNAPDLRFRM
jgi:DNA-binding transcriptional LysR family regulator